MCYGSLWRAALMLLLFCSQRFIELLLLHNEQGSVSEDARFKFHVCDCRMVKRIYYILYKIKALQYNKPNMCINCVKDKYSKWSETTFTLFRWRFMERLVPDVNLHPVRCSRSWRIWTTSIEITCLQSILYGKPTGTHRLRLEEIHACWGASVQPSLEWCRHKSKYLCLYI